MTEEKGFVYVGGHRLAYTRMGTGSPVVVLEAGAGTPRGTWNKIMPAIAEFTQVVSYDRASVGESDPGPRGRTCRELVDDLSQLLHTLQLSSPYVLVGNSLGGHIIRYFSYQHPGEVAGIILLDSVHHDQIRQAFALMPHPLPTDSSDLSTLRRNLTNIMNGMISEPDQDPEGLDYRAMDEQVRKTGSLGNMPLVVITAGSQAGADLPPDYRQAYRRMFRDLQVELSRLSTRGKHMFVERSGHFIQEDEPALVVDTVRQMVDLTRQDVSPV